MLKCGSFAGVFLCIQPFTVWCPLKGHIYLNKLSTFSSIYDLLVVIRDYKVKSFIFLLYCYLNPIFFFSRYFAILWYLCNTQGLPPNFTSNIKDTHRGEIPSNKILALTKSTNVGIWVVGTVNWLFIRGS